MQLWKIVLLGKNNLRKALIINELCWTSVLWGVVDSDAAMGLVLFLFCWVKSFVPERSQFVSLGGSSGNTLPGWPLLVARFSYEGFAVYPRAAHGIRQIPL